MPAISDSSLAPVIIREAIDQGPFTSTQLLVVVVALLLNMLDGFDVTAMAFTVHSVGQDLAISADRLGFVFSVTLAGMMLGALFIAPFSDVVGRRRMLLVCVTVIGLSMIATGYASALWQLLMLRSITGLGVGGMLACLATISSEYTPKKHRSLAVVTITAGYPLGATVGGFIAAPLIPAYGWQSIFIGGGVVTLLMVVAIFFYVPESLQYLLAKRPDNALGKINHIMRRLGKPELEALPEQETNVHQVVERAHVLSLLVPERRRETLTLWSTFFFCFICLYFMMSWIPKLVIVSGLSESIGVHASVAFNAGAVVGIVFLGWLSARIGLSLLITFFLVSAGFCMVLFALADGIEYLFFYLILIGFLLQGGFVGLYAVAAKIYPTHVRATGVGWAIGLGRFGAVVGPYVGGVLIAGGMTMELSFIIFAAPLVLSGVLAYWLRVS